MPHRRDAMLGVSAALMTAACGGRPVWAQAAPRQAAPREEEWSLGGLAGTLTLPAGANDVGSIVLIVAGSGPTDRDGNQPNLRTDSYRMLADGLARAGFASLRYDKRGVGESKALVTREDDVVFDDFVGDAIRISRSLLSDGYGPVVLAGHSEGGLVAIEAAPRARPVGLILLATPGRPLRAVLETQLTAAPMPADLRAEMIGMFDTIANGGRVADVPVQLMPVLRPSLQPFLTSVLKLDPAAALARLNIPVQIVWGARDIQISRVDFDALAKARPDAATVVLPTANHALKPAPADRDGNIEAYTDPALALDPDLAPAMAEFVRSMPQHKTGPLPVRQ